MDGGDDRPDVTRTDRGDLRDKVAAPDPAAAPTDADSEAAGAASGAARAVADREQARVAQRAVPKLDPDRAVSTLDRDAVVSARACHRDAMRIAALVAIALVMAAVLLALTL
jgi:hypothetical protein